MTTTQARGDGKYITEVNFDDVLFQYAKDIVERMSREDLVDGLITLICAGYSLNETSVALEAKIIETNGEDYLKLITSSQDEKDGLQS